MELFANFMTRLDTFIWGIPMIVLLLGTHIFMTIRTGFIQRKTFTGIRLSITRDEDSPGDVSQFQALTTTLASTIGTGNIVGVGTAVFTGGPGAVFWCWISGFFGIATKYAESLIAVKYRVRNQKGEMQGGAMYALERGLNMKWLGMLFALFTAIATFGIGCGTQINAISEIIRDNISTAIPPIAIGVVGGILTAVVILGGIQSIAQVCEKLVPFMSFFYIGGCLVILFINRAVLVDTLVLIMKSAFTPQAVAGGLLGRGIMVAARAGISRGLFSNESGLGSAPLVASAAQTPNPVKQALVASTGTFWSTLVVCLMTGLVLVSSVISNPSIDLNAISNGGQLTSAAFSQIPVVGPLILVVGIVTFSFSTILGWSYYGERCAEYLLGRKVLLPYRLVYVLVVVVAPVLDLNLIWTISNVLNAFMAIPNLVAVLLLSGVIAAETKTYLNDLHKVDTSPIPTVDR